MIINLEHSFSTARQAMRLLAIPLCLSLALAFIAFQSARAQVGSISAGAEIGRAAIEKSGEVLQGQDVCLTNACSPPQVEAIARHSDANEDPPYFERLFSATRPSSEEIFRTLLAYAVENDSEQLLNWITSDPGARFGIGVDSITGRPKMITRFGSDGRMGGISPLQRTNTGVSSDK